jgi:hypothetical protein
VKLEPRIPCYNMKKIRWSYELNLLYFQTVLSYFLEGFMMSKKIYQVVDDLQDAVVGKSPKV